MISFSFVLFVPFVVHYISSIQGGLLPPGKQKECLGGKLRHFVRKAVLCLRCYQSQRV